MNQLVFPVITQPQSVYDVCLLSVVVQAHAPTRILPVTQIVSNAQIRRPVLEEWYLAILFLCWASIYEPDWHELLDMIHYIVELQTVPR